MANGLRRYISARLFLAILGSGLLAGGGVFLVGLSLFESTIDKAVEDKFIEAENRIAILDTVLSRAERESERRGRAALVELSRRYPSLAAAEAASESELAAAAAELGVSDVYFIRKDGVIRATSFRPDLGVNLYGLGGTLKTVIGGLFDTGRFILDRLSVSTQSFTLLSYQYYGPPGLDYVVEVSTTLDDIIAGSYPGYDLLGLVRLLSNAEPAKKQAIVKPLNLVWGRSPPYRSFLSDAPLSPEVEELVMEASIDGNEASRQDGTRTTIARVIDLEDSGLDFKDEIFVVLEVDRSDIASFAFNATVMAIALIGVASASFYAFALRAFGRRLTSRLERLEVAMGEVALGAETSSLDDGGSDEIASIARSAEAMVAQIRDRNAELSSLAARLEAEVASVARREAELEAALEANQALVHELDHRVNNNLQLAMSLASMQSRASTSEAVTAALDRMRSRLSVVAMIQDQSLRQPSVDMGQLLATLIGDIASGFGPATNGVTRRVETGELRLPQGVAVDLCFIAAELLDNAYRYAFGSGTGALEVVMAEVEGRLILRVSDNGAGQPRPGGVGLELCSALAEQLGGRLSWSTGPMTTVELAIPSPGRAPPLPVLG